MKRVQLIDKQGKTCFDSASFIADSLVDWNSLLVEAASGRLEMRLEPSTDASAAASSSNSSSNPPTSAVQELLHYLLDRGAEVNFGNGLAHPALLAAVDFGHEPAVRLLLDRGLLFHRDALSQAARAPHPDIARTLLEYLPPVHNGSQTIVDGLNRLLFDAAFNGYTAILPILLDAGAVVDAIASISGFPALAAAVSNQHVDTVLVLLNRSADVNITFLGGRTALMYATARGNEVLTQILLDRGADSNAARTDNGQTALMVATSLRGVDLTQMLLDRGADPNAACTDDGCTALMMATSNENVALTQILLDRGANPNAARTDDGATALMMATSRGNVVLTQMLLDRGADPNAARPDDGVTALVMATSLGNVDLTQILLDRGADPNAADTDNGQTALMVATSLGNVALTQMLLDCGADANAARTDNGRTALMMATSLENGVLTQILLDRGADPNAARTYNGDTVLIDAAQRGRWAMMDLLVGAGAETDATNQSGQSARTLAVDFLRPHVTHIMRGEGMAELTRATEEGAWSGVAALLEISATAPARAGDNADNDNRIDWAALINMVVQSGNVHIAREILVARASIDLENTGPSIDLSAELNVAVEALNWDMSDLLRDFGAQIYAPVGDRNTTSLDLAINALSRQVTEQMTLQLNNHLMSQLTENEAIHENVQAEFKDAFLTEVDGIIQLPIQALTQEATPVVVQAAIQIKNAVPVDEILNAQLISASQHSHTQMETIVELFIRNMDISPVAGREESAINVVNNEINPVAIFEEDQAVAGPGGNVLNVNALTRVAVSLNAGVEMNNSVDDIFCLCDEAPSDESSNPAREDSSNFSWGEGGPSFSQIMPVLVVGGIGFGLGAYLPQFQNSLGCSLNPWIEHSAFGG